MVRHLVAGLACLLLCAAPAAAQGRAAALWDALKLDEVIEVMRGEGIAHAEELEETLFPGRGGAGWRREVAAIHDRARMRDWVASRLDGALGEGAAAAMLDFFTGDLGRRIVALEIGARKAIRDGEAEAAAIAAARRLPPARRAHITDFIDANDLLERNVVGAMNANLAFYRGLAEGGAFDGALTEERILADVRASAPEIRAETEAWLYGFLGLAYGPLSDAELDRYVALSESGAGQALNAALFTAFDGLHERISRDLGRRAAGYLSSEEL